MRGAKPIALFLFGKDDLASQRKVYALDKGLYGLFYDGKLICGLKSGSDNASLSGAQS